MAVAFVFHEARGRPRRLAVARGRGRFYVCAVDAGRLALVAGPFRRHRAARRWYRRAKDLAIERDPYAWFYQWGTCRLPTFGAARPGALNGALGLGVRCDGR